MDKNSHPHGYKSKKRGLMEKAKITPELVTKLLREHAEMLSLIQYAPEDGSGEDYAKWWDKRKNLLSKIKKLDD